MSNLGTIPENVNSDRGVTPLQPSRSTFDLLTTAVMTFDWHKALAPGSVFPHQNGSLLSAQVLWQHKISLWLTSPRFLCSELTISVESQCINGSFWHKLVTDDCCTDQLAATWLLHFCCLSCCSVSLFTCAFTCTLYVQWLTVSQQHDGSDSICVPPPVFKHTSVLATKGERRGNESRREREKKRALCFWHTQALSFCSVTLLRSAGPPFCQSWTTAKKTPS